ncbi:hypothetical protein [Mumia sp. DW29H23]|uniref:hypothetical protein n=1 Tax=Mumia sp. DW29H23 TaxID=3421241 RepID=UPI003D698865
MKPALVSVTGAVVSALVSAVVAALTSYGVLAWQAKIDGDTARRESFSLCWQLQDDITGLLAAGMPAPVVVERLVFAASQDGDDEDWSDIDGAYPCQLTSRAELMSLVDELAAGGQLARWVGVTRSPTRTVTTDTAVAVTRETPGFRLMRWRTVACRVQWRL